jgi:hypothetical protein
MSDVKSKMADAIVANLADSLGSQQDKEIIREGLLKLKRENLEFLFRWSESIEERWLDRKKEMKAEGLKKKSYEYRDAYDHYKSMRDQIRDLSGAMSQSMKRSIGAASN